MGLMSLCLCGNASKDQPRGLRLESQKPRWKVGKKRRMPGNKPQKQLQHPDTNHMYELEKLFWSKRQGQKIGDTDIIWKAPQFIEDWVKNYYNNDMDAFLRENKQFYDIELAKIPSGWPVAIYLHALYPPFNKREEDEKKTRQRILREIRAEAKRDIAEWRRQEEARRRQEEAQKAKKTAAAKAPVKKPEPPAEPMVTEAFSQEEIPVRLCQKTECCGKYVAKLPMRRWLQQRNKCPLCRNPSPGVF